MHKIICFRKEHMVAAINFRDADSNRNGRLEIAEFREKVEPLLMQMLQECDLNKDGYISNGKGTYWYSSPLYEAKEDGVDEIALLKKYNLPVEFGTGKLSNQTARGAADARSFSYGNDGYTRYFWKSIGGPTRKSGHSIGAIDLSRLAELCPSSLIRID
jgi:hypothetical protein